MERKEGEPFGNGPRDLDMGSLHEFPRRVDPDRERLIARLLCREGDFFRQMSDESLIDLGSLAHRSTCSGAAPILTEGQRPASTILLLEGKAKLTLNSIDGRRLIVGFASPGDILGLASAISGEPYEFTAEAQYKCVIATLPRQYFLDFLLRSPVASRNVGRQLSGDFGRSLEQLRMIGLTANVRAKLARLLLEWCPDGELVRCSFTHGEIGECLGASRESITRCLSNLKRKGLVSQRGMTLTVRNRRALAVYAGIKTTPNPNAPAA
jgi:CRP/FNR family transcriptional regulator